MFQQAFPRLYGKQSYFISFAKIDLCALKNFKFVLKICLVFKLIVFMKCMVFCYILKLKNVSHTGLLFHN